MKMSTIFIFVLLTICLTHGTEVAAAAECRAKICEFDTIQLSGYDRNVGGWVPNPLRNICDWACQRKFGDSVFGRRVSSKGFVPDGISCTCFKACVIH
ncbi:unnamed protein product [Linum tenue]|uniref:Uncharacterized protein n=1 Tax=Linum tenue TaxID=586396 RepID=A0AAV0IQX9_9ROSI|nr:unnamed protein product [Linum tenue]